MPDLRQGCATGKSTEETMPADALVLFGTMGDLAHNKKIFPTLCHMVQRLPSVFESSCVLSCQPHHPREPHLREGCGCTGGSTGFIVRRRRDG